MTSAHRHVVYLLRCADHTLYAGYTTDPDRRLAEHNAGTGARYTRGRRPVTLLQTWSFATVSEALRFEAALKRLPRARKEALAAACACDGSSAPPTPPP